MSISRYFNKKSLISTLILFFLSNFSLFSSEANLKVPVLDDFQNNLLIIGMFICAVGLVFGLYQFLRIKKFPIHKSMDSVAKTIFETCKTYLIQQGKFILILEIFIAICIVYYFGFLQHTGIAGVLLILFWSVIGILGSYSVAWFGIRINTIANGRMAFASLEKKPLKLLGIPLGAGISIGVLLVSVELLMMLIIILFVPKELAGSCFIGFAIGESLGASALRIAGGIFTKIADIGSDLMKIVFNLKEDDPRNPGVIADCTGDNAGDSVGPTADGFETYGVTGVALISFICLGVFGMGDPKNTSEINFQTHLITWIFVMRVIMIITSVISYYINNALINIKYKNKEKIDFEFGLTTLIWITSIISIIVTFIVTYIQLGFMGKNIWLSLSIIISCGTIAAAIIPELTKAFTSSKSIHVKEVVHNSREGGASLNILSGLVAGNFSAFWIGFVIVVLMTVAYFVSLMGLPNFTQYPAVFAFGLLAFGFLGMGPVTIAVDSYGPVTDNAQSVYELSVIENLPNIKDEIKKDYGFTPDFKYGKEALEENDSCGNTFKATAKPVLIGTAVVGATTMIFSLILVLKDTLNIQPEFILNLLNPFDLIGFLCGGAVIFWFTGASKQAVTTGAYRAVKYIKDNIQLDENANQSASIEKSKEVVKICTQYAQSGMFNIFMVIFSFSLSFAFLSAPLGGNNQPAGFFISYLISIAIFGLFQAIFMANAGGAWDNAKKIVEVELKEKGTSLHSATIVGDTVGDPFKDTTSVALNPIIKFTTLFGLLAMEIAISPTMKNIADPLGIVFLVIGLIFIIRSFYGMRIPKDKVEEFGK